MTDTTIKGGVLVKNGKQTSCELGAIDSTAAFVAAPCLDLTGNTVDTNTTYEVYLDTGIDSKSAKYTVESITVHPEYNSTTFLNPVAVLQFNKNSSENWSNPIAIDRNNSWGDVVLSRRGLADLGTMEWTPALTVANQYVSADRCTDYMHTDDIHTDERSVLGRLALVQILIGKPKAGETMLVSSASGAVGQMAVQLAKVRGLKVVAVAGSDDKVEYVKSLGADVAFNYNICGNHTETIKKAAPEGIDIYFENVGGPFLGAVLANINPHGRIIVCGTITQHNISVKNFTAILTQKVTVRGFIIFDYYNTQEQTDFFNEMSRLYKEGKIQYKVDVTEGLDNAPRALLNLYEGKNFGKTLLKA
ncbi:hypothetical protein IWW48_004097 [Coemansia sp. RSA 1200]|nr:hypothetical protein IWW48_004097 [Coemansia sp. RSA 1200]